MLLVSLISNNLSSYGRRHFKLFTNCHVSWDTLIKSINEQLLLVQNITTSVAVLLFYGLQIKTFFSLHQIYIFFFAWQLFSEFCIFYLKRI